MSIDPKPFLSVKMKGMTRIRRAEPHKLRLVIAEVFRYIATLPGEEPKTSSTQVSLTVPSYLAALFEPRRQSVANPSSVSLPLSSSACSFHCA